MGFTGTQSKDVMSAQLMAKNLSRGVWHWRGCGWLWCVSHNGLVWVPYGADWGQDWSCVLLRLRWTWTHTRTTSNHMTSLTLKPHRRVLKSFKKRKGKKGVENKEPVLCSTAPSQTVCVQCWLPRSHAHGRRSAAATTRARTLLHSVAADPAVPVRTLSTSKIVQSSLKKRPWFHIQRDKKSLLGFSYPVSRKYTEQCRRGW